MIDNLNLLGTFFCTHSLVVLNVTLNHDMGRLIKSHWARLIILTAAFYQVGASIEGFIWPKIFWDFSTKNLDSLVKPFPFLQITNVLLGLAVVGFEWPIKYVAGNIAHRNIIARTVVYPLCSFAALLMYQSTNPAIYSLIGTGIYLWAFSEGEVSELLVEYIPQLT